MDDSRHYGIYRGTCYDNSDPQNINRIKVICPQVLSTNPSNWASAVNPVTGNSTHTAHTDSIVSGTASSGTAHTHAVVLNASHSSHTSVPNIGQGVWVMFEGGDVNFPVWLGVF